MNPINFNTRSIARIILNSLSMPAVGTYKTPCTESRASRALINWVYSVVSYPDPDSHSCGCELHAAVGIRVWARDYIHAYYTIPLAACPNTYPSVSPPLRVPTPPCLAESPADFLQFPSRWYIPYQYSDLIWPDKKLRVRRMCT